jgi:Domain of unknown function (DUF3644)
LSARQKHHNLIFLIGLRNQVEHKKAIGWDSYLSARYQACALNFNSYLKRLHGEKFGLDHNLALSLQFAELDYAQAQVIKDKENLIPSNIMSYIATFDAQLSNEEIESERFAYRLLFTRVTAKRHGQADRVIEFIDPKSEMAKNISKDYWVKEETEKPKLSAKQVVRKVREAGFGDFGMHQHTQFWKKHYLSWTASGKATIRSPFSSGFDISENTSVAATAAARNGSHSRLSVFLQAFRASKSLVWCPFHPFHDQSAIAPEHTSAINGAAINGAIAFFM